ncbi:MAG TPA: tyrosine-type recombinase/integrase [Trebonia sp.]|jgi:integrase|nr:tyrosine-type recombinase/integrase [Trebonia sp.]
MIERRGDSWRARYRGPDRRERSKSFKRKADAERWLVQQRSLMAQGDWTDPALGRITFAEYTLAWLASRADLKPKTRHQYWSLLNLHILPTWGTVPLAKITFEGLTQWVAHLTAGGLGPSGVRQSVFVVSAALDHAVRSGRIRSNPARGLGLPRPGKRDYVFLTHGEVRTLAAEAGPWHLLVLVLAYTGMRWGEATALRVCDIDLARRRIDVRRAFSDVGGKIVLGTPKSHQSRTVPVPRFIAAELATATNGKHPDQLVFTMPGGSIVRLSNWRRAAFLPARSRAELSDRFRVHDLRHTAASLMIQAGYPPKMLQEILGHASITTTLDLYGHLYPGEMDRYAERLDDAAGEADAAKMRPNDEDADSGEEEPAS